MLSCRVRLRGQAQEAGSPAHLEIPPELGEASEVGFVLFMWDSDEVAQLRKVDDREFLRESSGNVLRDFARNSRL